MNPQGAIAYQTANQIGNNLQQSFTKRKDENAIESILAEANSTNDPKVLQDTIGKILSNVSPERQGAAIKYLENAYKNVKDQEKLGRERKSAVDIGVNPDLPPTLQVAQFKEKSKSGRIENANKVFNQPDNRFKETNLDQNQIAVTQPDMIPERNQENQRKQQLLQLTGHPDREVSERAKAELKNIETNEKLNQKKDEVKIKRQTDISQEILKQNEKEAQELTSSESSLSLMEDAIVNKDLSFFSPDNLAEVTGIEAFRSPEGALFKTAGKEFFLGNLTRAGARPNQFIEKQIVEMLPKIGRSTAANLSVARAFKNEIDLKKEKVKLTRDLSDELEAKLGYVPRNIGQLRDEKLKVYAENKQKELNNDLRAYKSIEDKSSQSFMKVTPGTPISKVVAKVLLDKYDKKDPERANKAAKDASELGYAY